MEQMSGKIQSRRHQVGCNTEITPLPSKMLLLHTRVLIVYKSWVTEAFDPLPFVLEKPTDILQPCYNYLNSKHPK